MAALPLRDAARELGVSARQLERDVAAGAPVARRGGRGRGRVTLVDPAAIAAWRSAGAPTAGLLALSAELPELVANAVDDAFRQTEGPHKAATAGAMAGTWYLVTTAILDRLRREMAEVPELSAVPDKIDRLRRIFRDSRMVGSSVHDEER
jgi:hypothetical protein